MPELPDVAIYLEHIERVALGHRLDVLELHTPFILRSVDPPAAAFAGKTLIATQRMGKRLVLEFEDELFAVIHLMIAGRLHWMTLSKKADRKRSQFSFRFDDGQLRLTEAGTKRRASLHLVRGAEVVRTLDPGGVELLGKPGKGKKKGAGAATLDQFSDLLRMENHTLKRTLTDPRLFSGIGGAYADEILHRAKLSPVALSQKISDEEVARLHEACVTVLQEWVDRLRTHYGKKFPEGVTAFRPEMAVHGKFGQPCPVCGTPVQRIVYADRETNYCPGCQTNGKLLADRALSRLLRGDWPKTLEELENLKRT